MLLVVLREPTGKIREIFSTQDPFFFLSVKVLFLTTLFSRGGVSQSQDAAGLRLAAALYLPPRQNSARGRMVFSLSNYS